MIFVAGLLLLALVGVPLFALLGSTSLLLFLEQPGGSWSAPAIDLFSTRFAQNPALPAVPLYVFAACALSGPALLERPEQSALARFGLVPLLLYGVVTGLSVERMIAAAIAPGLLVLAVLVLHGALAGSAGALTGPPLRVRDALAELLRRRWSLAVPAALLAGTALGVLRVHEAAALAALYALALAVLVRRTLHPVRDLPRVIATSAALSGAVLVVLATALGITAFLVQAELPARFAAQAHALVGSTAAFLLAINAFLLLVGAALDVFTATAVVAPLLPAMAEAYGVDLQHMAVIFLLNLAVGRVVGDAEHTALPFRGALAAALLVVTYVPVLSTWLPLQIFG